MHQEIFGPVLPILEFLDVESVIGEINSNPKPLALYVFANDDDLVNRVIEENECRG